MNIGNYISWTGLKCDDVVSLFVISKLNGDYNENEELGEFWKELRESIVKGLELLSLRIFVCF